MRGRVLAIGLVLLSGSLLAEPVALEGSPAQAATAWRVKIFSVNTPPNQYGAALKNPYVAGISVRFGWKGIEPQPGVYRWKQIDDAIHRARAAGKKIMIRVMAGAFTPQWVLARTRTLTFAPQYLARAAITSTMPIPWDRGYLRLWKHVISHLGRRYDGNPTIYSFQMAGAGYFGEMALPTDVQKWLNAGYKDRKLIRAWKGIVRRYRRSFHRTPLNLDIGEPFGSLRNTNVYHPVVRFATRAARKAWIQQNGLRSSLRGMIGPYRTTIRKQSHTTRVGYQMLGETGTASQLKGAFKVALQDHVDYVEVYASDVLAGANQGALRYLASGGA